MRLFAFVAALSIADSGVAHARYLQGPYLCPFPPYTCQCGYSEKVECVPTPGGYGYCTTFSECMCQSNIGHYQFCGTWAESTNTWTPNVRKRAPSAPIWRGY